jgi:hypothetical protein
MNPAEALYQARELGAVFTVSGKGQVKVSGPLQLSGSLMADLKANKREIISLLGKVPDYSATACTCEQSIGGTGSERCGVCGLPLICSVCSKCRSCKRMARLGKDTCHAPA